MDYEKKYKEALERAREFQHDNCWVTSIFPELKESEDERIRKKLIEAIKGDMVVGGTKDKQRAIAWLEKQGKPNPAWSEDDKNRFGNLIWLVNHSNENRATKEGFIKFINRLKSLKKIVQPQQKEWSEEDEENLNQLYKLIVEKAYREYEIDTEDETLYGKWLKLDNWLKSLKERIKI